MYLLDASVIIDANELYYPIERFPEFWAWLAHQGAMGNVKVPAEMWSEVQPSDPALQQWMSANEDHLVLDDSTYLADVPQVQAAYAVDLDEAEVEQIGNDPFLIAAARRLNATTVTRETSKPKRKRANRHIPDVCKDLDVPCINDHQLIRDLNFTTAWRP